MDVKNELKLIKKEFDENVNSHVFLIETNDLSLCEEEIKNLISSYLPNDENKLKQIRADEYIDLIVIRPDGRFIKRDKIFALQERLKLRPTLSNRLFYIITPANCLNEIASNKLLKTIEEPYEDVVGFLITDNPSQILPTIKSRCEKISAYYEKKVDVNVIDTELMNYACSLINIIENGTLGDYNLYLLNNSEVSTKSKEIIELIRKYYSSACGVESLDNLEEKTLHIIIEKNSYKELVRKSKYLNMLTNKLNVNANGDLLLEKIFIDLEEIK